MSLILLIVIVALIPPAIIGSLTSIVLFKVIKTARKTRERIDAANDARNAAKKKAKP